MSTITFNSNINNVFNSLEQAEERILTAIGMFAEGKVVTKITEMDAVDTSYLRGSIHYKVKKSEKKVIIGTNTEYSVYVHEGTRKMRKRPFLKDGVYQNISGIRRVAEDAGRQGMT